MSICTPVIDPSARLLMMRIAQMGHRFPHLPFLPPYDIGTTAQEEGVELIFRPTAEIHSIDYILSNLTESFTIYDDLGIAEGDSFGVDGRTKLTDSIQLKRKVKVGDSSRAVPSAPEYAISIQPKVGNASIGLQPQNILHGASPMQKQALSFVTTNHGSLNSGGGDSDHAARWKHRRYVYSPGRSTPISQAARLEKDASLAEFYQNLSGMHQLLAPAVLRTESQPRLNNNFTCSYDASTTLKFRMDSQGSTERWRTLCTALAIQAVKFH